jgi:transcription elongation GreA/GreB family factor
MNPDIQKAVEAGKISKSVAGILEHFTPGACVLHKNWGFGQIANIDFLINQITIDFATKKGHSMQLQYAADSLQRIDREHILARIALDLEGVRKEANQEPEQFVRAVLTSYSGKLTVDQLTRVLAPAVFNETGFKKWWDGAKKVLKKSGHFSLPTKKTEPILYREEAVSRSSEHLETFASARQLKDQIGALERILRELEEFKDSVTQLQSIISVAEETARRNAKMATAEALTMLTQRDEMVERVKELQAGAAAPTIASMLLDEQRALSSLLEEVPAAKLRRVVNALPSAFGDAWTSKALQLVARGSTRVVTEAARLMQEHEKNEELKTALDRAIRDHSISSSALTWLCDKKEREGQFKSLIHPRVMSAILSALERDQFNENRDRKLHDLVVNDQTLLPDLIKGSEIEEVREAMRKLLLTPIFEDLNKRSLLGRFVRHFPELEVLISGEREEKHESLIVSWESLEKRQLEYEDIITKKIPENTKEIAIAREYGDLRENFEFKAAKEMQRVLMRRKQEMERDISLARGTDFANPDTKQVSIGTTVSVKGVKDNQVDTYHILGAWDTNPEQGIISYKAAIAQSLMGRKCGEMVDLPTEGADRTVEILTIAAWIKA